MKKLTDTQKRILEIIYQNSIQSKSSLTEKDIRKKLGRKTHIYLHLNSLIKAFWLSKSQEMGKSVYDFPNEHIRKVYVATIRNKIANMSKSRIEEIKGYPKLSSNWVFEKLTEYRKKIPKMINNCSNALAYIKKEREFISTLYLYQKITLTNLHKFMEAFNDFEKDYEEHCRKGKLGNAQRKYPFKYTFKVDTSFINPIGQKTTKIIKHGDFPQDAEYFEKHYKKYGFERFRFSLLDDDRIEYYRGYLYTKSKSGEAMLSPLYEFGMGYAGTTIMRIWDNGWKIIN